MLFHPLTITATRITVNLDLNWGRTHKQSKYVTKKLWN